jgi:hypothetical protein
MSLLQAQILLKNQIETKKKMIEKFQAEKAQIELDISELNKVK